MQVLSYVFFPYLNLTMARFPLSHSIKRRSKVWQQQRQTKEGSRTSVTFSSLAWADASSFVSKIQLHGDHSSYVFHRTRLRSNRSSWALNTLWLFQMFSTRQRRSGSWKKRNRFSQRSFKFGDPKWTVIRATTLTFPPLMEQFCGLIKTRVRITANVITNEWHRMCSKTYSDKLSTNNRTKIFYSLITWSEMAPSARLAGQVATLARLSCNYAKLMFVAFNQDTEISVSKRQTDSARVKFSPALGVLKMATTVYKGEIRSLGR